MDTTIIEKKESHSEEVKVKKFLEGETVFIFGVANKRSIAWGIAQAFNREGARVALAYQSRLKENVEELAQSLNDPVLVECDVTDDAQIESAFKKVASEFGSLEVLVHCIAFAKREELDGSFFKITREGYHVAQDVSAYSLIALAKVAAPLMKGRDGSIIALTYLGGWRVIPGYNVMGIAKAALEASVRYLANEVGPQGIRVNGISAGPIKTLASRGLSDFDSLYKVYAEKAPLRRNVTGDEVGDVAVFLASHFSRGVTGEILFVDAGYHILGV